MGFLKKKQLQILCGLLAGCMLAVMVPASVYADEEEEEQEEEKEDLSAIQDSIKQKEAEISKANKEKKDLMSGLNNIKNIVNGLQSEKKDLEKYVVKLDANLTEIEAEIARLKDLISKKEKEILETAKELDKAVETEENQYQSMKKRVRFLYEKGGTYYAEMLFQSSSFSEFLNRKDYIEKLSDYDQKTLETYVANRKLIEICKKELEADEELLKEAKKKVDEQQENVEILISDKEKEINKYAGDIKEQNKAIAEYEASIAVQNDVIQALESALAEQRKQLAEEGGEELAYDGGMFKWPCPNYTRISDDYGMRMHPTLHVNKFHNGIDLAAPSGSPILAAYDGEVIAADYNGSMGNYVMINHGGGLITIYMHASSLDVSKGTWVTKGQKIAGVGTTGRSTGNHLHFGVRLNGSYVSPWNYLSK